MHRRSDFLSSASVGTGASCGDGVRSRLASEGLAGTEAAGAGARVATCTRELGTAACVGPRAGASRGVSGARSAGGGVCMSASTPPAAVPSVMAKAVAKRGARVTNMGQRGKGSAYDVGRSQFDGGPVLCNGREEQLLELRVRN